MKYHLCPIHKENKVYIYTKRSSKIAVQKIDVGKQCETCLVGVLNTMNALIPEDLIPKEKSDAFYGITTDPATKARRITERESCPCGNLQSENPRPAITCYDGACK